MISGPRDSLQAILKSRGFNKERRNLQMPLSFFVGRAL